MRKKIIEYLPLIIFLLIFLGPVLRKEFFLFLLLIIGIIFLANKIRESDIKKSEENINNSFTKRSNNNMAQTIDLDSIKNIKKAKNLILGLVFLVFAGWLFFSSIVIVEAGETGVYSLFGKVKDEELKSGFHLVIPLAKVTRMSVRTEEYTMSVVKDEGRKTGVDSIAALTKEGLNIDLDITVLYRLNEDKAADVYDNIGLNYDEKLIRPSIRTVIRDIIAQYSAKDIYSEKRDEASDKIKEKLLQELTDRGIIVENILMRNVVLPPNLANAIQEKLQAEQEAQKYDFILDKEKKEKERKLIEAEGQRDAQRIINESLSTNYLYYLYMNELKDREGTVYVPTSPSTGMPLFRELGR